MNIWQELPKPFLVLAPMDDVTDTVFRRIVAGCARPDVFFTEFVSADGLQSAGRERVMPKLLFTDEELPLVAQIWGMKPQNYYQTARELVEMGYSGIDINMGCPVPKIIKLGACSALINNRELATEIIQATIAGVADSGRQIPVSVKTRVGFNEVDLSWTEHLLKQGISALTIHGRTAKQLSKVPNDWDLIGQIRQQRDSLAPDTVFIGNGDAWDRQLALSMAEKHNLDGVMVGRGVFKDPFVFSDNSPWSGMDKTQRLSLYEKHIRLFRDTWGNTRNPAGLKKFAKVYVNGFSGASELRQELMEAHNADELLGILEKA